LKGGGEGGLLTYFADLHGIPILCPEPDERWLYNELLLQFSSDHILYRDFAHIVVYSIIVVKYMI